MDVKKIVDSIIFLSVITAAMGQKLINDVMYKSSRDYLRQPNHRPVRAPNPNDNFHDSQFKFAISILHLSLIDKSNESVYYSPYGIYRLLLLAYFGAKNKTKEELEIALDLDRNVG